MRADEFKMAEAPYVHPNSVLADLLLTYTSVGFTKIWE